MRRTIGCAAVLFLLAGCYTLKPAGGITPVVGNSVAFDINDVGRVALGGAMGPEIAQIEGNLVSVDSGSYMVGVTAVRLLRGGEQTWHGENVRINREHVATVYLRQFSKGRSIALGVLGAGAVAILASRGIIGSGQTDPAKTPPDTALTSRRGWP